MEVAFDSIDEMFMFTIDQELFVPPVVPALRQRFGQGVLSCLVVVDGFDEDISSSWEYIPFNSIYIYIY